MLTRGATPSRVMGWCARFARTAALSTSTLPRLYWVPPRSAHGSGPSRYITRVLSWRQLWCPSACGRGSSGGGVLPVVVAAATGATVAASKRSPVLRVRSPAANCFILAFHAFSVLARIYVYS